MENISVPQEMSGQVNFQKMSHPSRQTVFAQNGDIEQNENY